MKVYATTVARCADCPNEMNALPVTGMCGVMGKPIGDVQTIPEWCPLDDIDAEEELSDEADSE